MRCGDYGLYVRLDYLAAAFLLELDLDPRLEAAAFFVPALAPLDLPLPADFLAADLRPAEAGLLFLAPPFLPALDFFAPALAVDFLAVDFLAVAFFVVL